ncbi:MAG: cell division protein ZapA [Oscillospiraceae bacterium]|nr:cell division protein ZapA [Oscillospiraceae bacterium]
MPRKLRLRIAGFEYVVNTDEDPEYVRALTTQLNEKIAGLAEKNPQLSTTMVGILAALEYCDETKKARIDAENLRLQLKGFVEEIARARMETDAAQKRAAALARELTELNKSGQTRLP